MSLSYATKCCPLIGYHSLFYRRHADDLRRKPHARHSFHIQCNYQDVDSLMCPSSKGIATLGHIGILVLNVIGAITVLDVVTIAVVGISC